MSLPPEILKKVKMIELNTRRMVNNIFAGEYHTAFKGQGMTFAEFREYVPGDDVRAISWPVTARTGKTYIKKFEEERELTLIIAVDVSGSSDFGSGEYFKGEIMTHLAAVLAFSASKNNDQIGLLLFSDQVEHFVPPKKGRGHVHRILRDLLYYQPKSRQTNITSAVEYLQGVLKKRSTIFLFSDFMDDDYEGPLRLIGRKHDVVGVVVEDPMERELQPMGLVDFSDPETGEVITVDTSSPWFIKDYKKMIEARDAEREDKLRKARVDTVQVSDNENYFDPLIAFFKRRHPR